MPMNKTRTGHAGPQMPERNGSLVGEFDPDTRQCPVEPQGNRTETRALHASTEQDWTAKLQRRRRGGWHAPRSAPRYACLEPLPSPALLRHAPCLTLPSRTWNPSTMLFMDHTRY
ncbi:uncharacterized protein SPSK_04685 [Sporothrix schenckii 1099-18]|uniref:Uncharacterized protein n=1 Tax=Sporothrix schenckii 1099-18 TaxID=1397361 RepID=A0A0F2M173_SPOSC|nr:uncharacterized protein SPSK_04685 [Sporothrix schenckii 1099-18]KJR83442.1 hypothetical protein SPSK_04685 [Sporothrix schenckii 1099-18]